MKNPQMIMVNFIGNPTAITAAKNALQSSALGVTVQQDGTMLHIPVPRITRERRESLAHDAKVKLLHDYKEALNKVVLSTLFK
jgi:ribosome recycling factor